MSLAVQADLTYASTPVHRARVQRAAHELEAVADGRYAISWSGGKDSTVCLALAAEAWAAGLVIVTDNHQASTPLARLVDAWAERVPHLDFVVRPGRRPDDVDRAALVRLLDRCAVRGQVLGLRADESGYRRRIARNAIRDRRYVTASKWGSRPALCPILDWSIDDVWAYLHSHELPYHDCYQTDRYGRSPRRRDA